MTPLREQLGRFIAQLRNAGLRVSIAESIDAMNAVAAAGLARDRMREALAATLVKEDRKSTRLNSSHSGESRMPSSA